MPVRKHETLSATQRAELSSAKRAAITVGLAFPLLLVLIATCVLIAWLPRMPDPAATHWGFTGGPNGFGSPMTYVWMNLGMGVGVLGMIWLSLFTGGLKPGAPAWGATQRFLAAFCAGFGGFTVVMTVGSSLIQLDLADARDAWGVGWIAGVAFALWVIVSFAAWLAQPSVTIYEPGVVVESEVNSRTSHDETGGTLHQVAEPEPLVWVGESLPSKGYVWIITVALALLIATSVWMFVSVAEAWSAWLTLASTVLVAVLGAMSGGFRVRIDESGLVARSILGWPTFKVPATDVRKIEVRNIDPIAEFGGWGMRWAPGRTGLVMRKGEALVITRSDQRIFAVTLDESQRAAEVLAAVVARMKGASQ